MARKEVNNEVKIDKAEEKKEEKIKNKIPKEKKDNKKISNDVKSIDYLNPKNIYLPLFDHNESYECLVNLDQKVIKGEIVAVSTKTKIPLHSSVSGIVKSINIKYNINITIYTSIL